MIYITGDVHRDFDRVFLFCEKKGTTREDILIILGDAGINYFANEQDVPLKRFVESLPITVFCIHGNHEQRPYLIDGYKEMQWHGGTVYAEEDYPSILFAKDGEIYDFDGKCAIALGGAYSVDKYFRLMRGWNWYESEQPSEEIKKFVNQKLDSVNWKVDYVMSHTAPLRYEPTEVFLSGIDQSRVDKTTEEWLGEIEAKLDYKKWFCGHYHTSKKIDKIQMMFTDYDILEKTE